jgi:putative phosphoesterase
MRIAVISDIHGNLTAFEAVLSDLRKTSPDLILHGGDLVHGGSGSAEIVDRIRDLGWAGVLGNTDEMLFKPAALQEFAGKSPAFAPLQAPIDEMAAADREALGEARLQWLSCLPLTQIHGPLVLVHASPADPWRAPPPEAGDADLAAVYGSLGRPVAVYGHVHRACVRYLPGLIVANSGSVSLSFDGDSRAAYLLLDDAQPVIRRVEYDVEKEIQALAASGLPHSDWMIKTLRAARPQMP